MHKALLLVLDASAPSEKISVCVLNRPTANVHRFHLPGNPQRRAAFCGNLPLGKDLWLHHRPKTLGGLELENSGVGILSTEEVTEMFQKGQATVEDFLLVKSVVQFGRPELAGMMSKGDVRCLEEGRDVEALCRHHL